MTVKYRCPKCERKFVDWGAEKLGFKCPECDDTELSAISMEVPVKAKAKAKSKSKAKSKAKAKAKAKPSLKRKSSKAAKAASNFDDEDELTSSTDMPSEDLSGLEELNAIPETKVEVGDGLPEPGSKA
jgi:predicted  nucleic acid-binding Zn-ribbon protein